MVRNLLQAAFAFIPAILTVIFMPAELYGQARVVFRIDGAEGKFYLEEYYSHKVNLVDSAVSVAGEVVFDFPGEREEGMYRLSSARNNTLDFIYSGNEIEIHTSPEFTLEELQIVKDDQNRNFFHYMEMKDRFETKLTALDQLLARYPEEDEFFNLAVEEFRGQSLEYERQLDSLVNLTSGTFLHTVISWDQLPNLEPGMLDPETTQILRGHYFDPVDMTDGRIVRTPVLPMKVIDYLSLYIMPGVARDKQEELFIQGVDSLMVYSENNPDMRQAIVEYVIEGFERYGFENVITHIGENYVLGQSCVSEEEEEELRFRIEGFTRMAVGETAPKLPFTEAVESQKPYKLLFFWASWCPHCEDIIPSLKGFYRDHEDEVEIIAISVDTDSTQWKEVEGRHDMPWPSFAELKGWDGPVVQDYYVYATPTLYLLGKDGKIVAKPASIKELKSFFENR